MDIVGGHNSNLNYIIVLSMKSEGNEKSSKVYENFQEAHSSSLVNAFYEGNLRWIYKQIQYYFTNMSYQKGNEEKLKNIERSSSKKYIKFIVHNTSTSSLHQPSSLLQSRSAKNYQFKRQERKSERGQKSIGKQSVIKISDMKIQTSSSQKTFSQQGRPRRLIITPKKQAFSQLKKKKKQSIKRSDDVIKNMRKLLKQMENLVAGLQIYVRQSLNFISKAIDNQHSAYLGAEKQKYIPADDFSIQFTPIKNSCFDENQQIPVKLKRNRFQFFSLDEITILPNKAITNQRHGIQEKNKFFNNTIFIREQIRIDAQNAVTRPSRIHQLQQKTANYVKQPEARISDKRVHNSIEKLQNQLSSLKKLLKDES